MSDTNEPVAWAVTPKGKDDEIDCEFVYQSAATAGDVALDAGGVVVPLYRSPTLTDAEREAVEWAAFEFDGVRPDNGRAAQQAATLRSLLSRLSLPAT